MHVASLTPSDIEFGRRVNERVREKFGVKGVFWLYDDLNDNWRLVIATDAVDRIGARKTYVELIKRISDLQPSHFQAMQIEAVSPETPLLRALRSVFGSAASVEGATLQGTVVNGIRVSQAYLYELRN